MSETTQERSALARFARHDPRVDWPGGEFEDAGEAVCAALDEQGERLDTAIKSLRELVDAARAVNGVDNANSQKRQRLNGAIGEARSTLSKLERGTE